VKRVTATRGPWIELVEAIHNPARDDESWCAPIIDTAKHLFPSAELIGMYALDYAFDLSSIDVRFSHAAAPVVALDHAAHVANAFGRAVIQPFHFAGPVRTYAEAARDVPREARAAMDGLHASIGVKDGFGIVAHPIPGLVTVLHGVCTGPVRMTAYERRVLARIAFHLENGFRARLRPESIRAIIDTHGKVVHRERGAPDDAVLAAHATNLDSARSRKRRTSDESLDLWTALVEGRVSIVPRFVDGHTRYIVLDNPLPTRALRALTRVESAILSLAARGLSTKLVAYALGLAPSVVSDQMATAAAKVGAMSRVELVRLAAMFVGDPRSDLSTNALSAAEREVLDLLLQGLSNDQIAAARSRSARTIANQVASILSKTKKPSRRALIAAANRRTN
jgi:DNA-binding CsgD family transcriptional regulator